MITPMELSMRILISVTVLALCTSVSAQSIKLDTDSPVSTTTTIESNSSSSVTSSGNTSAVTHSVVGTTGSTCSTVVEGKRCEIACQAPQVAQCAKSADAGEPSCACK